MELTIKLENGKWTVNGKNYDVLSPNEKQMLNTFFENYKNQIDEKL
jgi:hypothetical protein